MKTAVTPMGDRHKNGQTVLIEQGSETFGPSLSYLSYVEKPRDFFTETAFLSLCKIMETIGIEAFSRPPVLIEEEKNKNRQQMERNLQTDENGLALYYRRAGILAFVCYLLGSTDMHCENIIASGDMPVVVDMETLLSGRPARSTRLYTTAETVLRSHLLCNFAAEDGKCVDVSGLSGTRAQLLNIPWTKERRGFIWDFEEHFLEGFTLAYDRVSENKGELEKGINLFSGCRVRQILRPTSVYAALSQYLQGIPQDKREAAAHACLSYAFDRDIDKSRAQRAVGVLKEEVRSVLAREIPLFYTLGDGRDLLCDGETVLSDHLERSPVDYARDRLRGLCEADKDRQLGLLRAAIHSCVPKRTGKAPVFSGNAVCEGEAIAEYITGLRINGMPTGFCELTQTVGATVYTALGVSLYSGLAGIMCMYGALYRRTEKQIYSIHARRCLRDLLALFPEGKEGSVLTGDTASLSSGLGGVIYSLIHLYGLTEERDYLRGAERLLEGVTSLDSRDGDLLNGIGIWPLIYVRLGKRPPEQIMKTLESVLCACEPKNTGVAHGASGLALSLGAMTVLGADVPKEKISRLISWENELFSEAEGNWRDVRQKDRPGFKSGWCSGAPGIAMARQELKRFAVDPSVTKACENDISRGVAFLERESPCKRDSLCCGTASRIMAASRLGIALPSLFEGLALAEKNGSIRLIEPADTAAWGLSLMQGLSGVAYALAMYRDSLSGGMLI